MTTGTSVVIPCYNGEEFLGQAVESVRAQTVAAREVIVIDDGSTVPVRLPESPDGPPVRVVRTPNRGLPAARNLGIEHATGEFVAFLDADDYWHPRKLERQEAALRADPAAVASYTRCVAGPGLFAFGPYPPADVPADEFLLVLWYNSFFPPSSVTARRAAVEEVRRFRADLPTGEDTDLWVRLTALGRFVQVPEPLTYYRQHPGQMTNDVLKKLTRWKAARAVMIEHYGDRLVRAGLRPDKLWDSHRNEVMLTFYRRQFPAARRLLWDYWRDHPADVSVLTKAAVACLPAGLVGRLRGRIPERPPPAAAPDADESYAGWRELVRRLDPVLAHPPG